MRKLYVLFALFAITQIQAQTTNDQAYFSFTVSPSGMVSFTNHSVIPDTANKKAYWFFGDGQKLKTLPLANATHQYANGVFTACLKIFRYSNNGNDSIVTADHCKMITIGQTIADSCISNYFSRDTMGPLTKYFKAEGWHSNQRPIERICWIFGDGKDTCIFPTSGTIMNMSVIHHYAAAGNYNVCVKIKYQGGCEATTCRSVAVAPPASSVDSCKAEFIWDPVTSTPMGRKFTALPWSINQKKVVKVCWIFGNGKDTCITYPANHTGPYTVSYVYPHQGSFNVCVKIYYDGGCMAQKCKIIVIGQPPIDSCFVAVNEIMQTASTLHRTFFAATSHTRRPEKIKWTFGDGKDTTILLPNPVTPHSLTISHLFTHPGSYNVCAKVWYEGGCIREHCRSVYIHGTNIPCTPRFIDSTVAPRTKLFVASATIAPNDSVISYKWSFGDGTSATGRQVVKMYNRGGLFEVCVVMRTKMGCEKRVCRHIAIHGPNLSTLHLSPNPVISTVNVMFQSNANQTVSVRIYNAMGIMVKSYTQTAVHGLNHWAYNVGLLVPGAYSVVVQSSSQFATAIFFKRN